MCSSLFLASEFYYSMNWKDAANGAGRHFTDRKQNLCSNKTWHTVVREQRGK